MPTGTPGVDGMNVPWEEVGEAIFRRRYRRLDQNIGVVVTAEGLLVIDSRATHGDADELRSDLMTLSPHPVRWLVNTHYHWDHTFGNARFPDAEIVGHVACRKALMERGEDMKRTLAASDWIPEEDRTSFEEVEITPPTLIFTDDLVVAAGDRDIHLLHLGHGHTDSDVVVLVDDVCFAGDLVEEGAPPSFGDAFPRQWVSTLDRLLPLLDRVVVPGHGDLVDAPFVSAQRDEMAVAIQQAGTGSGPYPAEVMEVVAVRLGRER